MAGDDTAEEACILDLARPNQGLRGVWEAPCSLHGPSLTDVPQRAETDDQDSGVLRERDDGVRETGLLDCERT